jgi:mono/diheme cytochrome c family protein
MKYLCFKSIALSLLLVSCSATAKPDKVIPEEFMEGQKQFNRVCASCHGPEGIGGGKMPKLTQKKFSMESFPNEKITSTILKGSKSGKMPSQKRRVKEGEIKEIIKYIRYLQTKQSI